MLGLPPQVTACLFDLDGVLTQTALVHNAAWKQTFDAFLETWSKQHGQPFVPFDSGDDYHKYVDGRQRADGVRTFLASRGITLPEGTPDDGPDQQTVNGVGNRKNLIRAPEDQRRRGPGLPRIRELPEGGEGGRAAPRRRVGQRQLQGRAGGGRYRRPTSR